MQRHSIAKATSLVILTVAALVVLFMSGPEGLTAIEIALALPAVYVCYKIVQLVVEWQRIKRGRRKPLRDFSVKTAAVAMAFCLVSGTALFMLAFCMIEGNEFTAHTVRINNVEYLMRSLLCSLDLFMLDIDSNILDRLDDQPVIKALISFQAALSFMCTVAFLVSLVFTRAKAYYKLSLKAKVDDRHNHLYIFFGVNEPSKKLATDIRRHDRGAVIVFIDEMRHSDNESDEWGNVVTAFTHRHQTFSLADNIDAYVAIANNKLHDIESCEADSTDTDAFDALGIRKVRKLILSLEKRTTVDPQLHIFFLSDDEDDNIGNVSVLARDTTVAKIVRSSVYCKFYCHARYSGLNRMVEDIAVRRHINIAIVDSSRIAVDLLKLDPDNHPVQVVRQDDAATVSQPLDCLIVGFGEVGRDALRFLYEFGAFVDSGSTVNNVRRSPFHCTVIDSEMDTLEGPFRASVPAIEFNHEVDNVEITLRKMDYREQRFFKEIMSDSKARTVNYVVLALNDDDANMSLAVRIFCHIRRFREDLSGLRIMVRCNSEEKADLMLKIASHYNYGYGSGNNNPKVLRLFGRPEEVYSFNVIVNEELTRRGTLFHDSYRRQRKEEDSWQSRRRSLTAPISTNGDTAGIPDIDRLQKLRRQEGQDLANALHTWTKTTLLRRAMPPDYDWTDFFTRYFNQDMTANASGHHDKITYPRLTERENRIILHLAMSEHLRWNASHEMLGYVRADKGLHHCDERTHQHNCLRPWQELDEESRQASTADDIVDYKGYDFRVVDTTIMLWANHINQ